MIPDELEQRKARLAAIIDSSDDAIISKDLNGIIKSWNKAAERMFEYKEEEVVGKHVSILIPKDRLQEEDMIISNLRAGKRIEHYETVRQTKSGKQLFISLTVSPIMAGEKIIGASKIARDITKQKEAEEEIRKYAEQLELINNTSKTIGADLNEERIIQKVTDSTTKIAGASFGAFFYNKADAKGETLMLYSLSGASREDFDKFGMPRNTNIFKTTFDGEGIIRSDDISKDERYGKNSPHNGIPKGHLPVVSYMAVPVISQTGVVIGGLIFGHSQPRMFTQEHENIISAIAVQAAMALDNAKLYNEIKILNGKKDEFIGYASHELKTPLTTISGYVQMAESKPELTTTFIPKIRRQINKLSAIIGDLLDISKIEANRFDLNLKHVSLSNFIKDTVESINQFSDTHTINYEVPLDDELVMIDSQKIGQVLINLLNNAIKYSPDANKVLLSAIRLGDQIQICVEDWGIGISPVEKENIFNRFYRISASRDKVDGLGVGLYIAQEIIEAHRGKIWVESEEGKGSCFYISFPIEHVRMTK